MADQDARHRDARFGNPIGTYDPWSRWFNGEPEIESRPVRPVQKRWLCPQEDCSGEMVFNGSTWPMSPQGYHHTCNKCEFTAALVGKHYPRIEYETES